MGKPRPSEEKGPDSCFPACNAGVPGAAPSQGPLSCTVCALGGQPGPKTGETMEQLGPLGPQRGMGACCLSSVRLSVSEGGRVSRGPSVGSHARPPSGSRPPTPYPPACQDERWRCPSPGPQPQAGSRSLAADTVCFPAQDAHPRHRPFLPAPPTPVGLPRGPGCWAGSALGSQRDGQTQPSPTLTCRRQRTDLSAIVRPQRE